MINDDECQEENMEGVRSEAALATSSLRQGGVLLEMLAEVASKTLLGPEKDVSMSPSPAKKKRRGGRSRKISTSESASSQIDLRTLPDQKLLRLFSNLECNELKRTFTLHCTFEPNSCHVQFTSFGSEARARKLMVAHLQNHVHMLPVAEMEQSETVAQQVTPGAASAVLFDHCYFHAAPASELCLLSTNLNYKLSSQDASTCRISTTDQLNNSKILVPNLPIFEQTVPEDSLPQVVREESVGYEQEIETEPTLRGMLSKRCPTREVKTLQQSEEVSEDVALPPPNHKPKGKAKFIGQSTADRTLALGMIEQIKSKQLSPLDSLQCHICSPPRTFTAPTTLLSHYRSHAGKCFVVNVAFASIKPFECRICQAAFTRQHSLNYHMLIHSNETRFTCYECGRKFRHPSHFREHQRRHTGEAPYECTLCSTRFKTRNTFKRHLKTRHDQELMDAVDVESNSPVQDSENFETGASVTSDNVAQHDDNKSSDSSLELSNTEEEEMLEDIVEKAMYCSGLRFNCDEPEEVPSSISMSHLTEIAKAILCEAPSPEPNNNKEEGATSVVDTVLTVKYTPAVNQVPQVGSEPLVLMM
ncbi:UNVERIFIED_CONTAM: hypothetical protein B566_EDAN017950 [Ephemera danica]|nr:hypothetical protein B566_EDAN017950 [Ephemera danica]